VMLPIQKSTAKLCRCQFRNRQWITVPLPIQKLIVQNYDAADSKIGSDGVIFGFNLLFFLCLHRDTSLCFFLHSLFFFLSLVLSLFLVYSFPLLSQSFSL
jgi:hypothetical protein